MHKFILVVVMTVGWGCASSHDKTTDLIKAQQSAPAAKKRSAPTGAEEVTRQPAPGEAVEQYYPGENLEHWIAIVLDRGARIKFEDDSVWEIAPKDRIQTGLWRVGDKISAVRGPEQPYRFQLSNGREGTTVDARLTSTWERR